MDLNLVGIVPADWTRISNAESFKQADLKAESEARAFEKAAKQGQVIVQKIVNLPFRESAGTYLSRFFIALRDEGKIVANKCPLCKRIVLPPRVICGYCKEKIEDVPENWVTLEDTGKVATYTITVEREVDYATNKIVGMAYPVAFIRLDGGDQYTLIAHYLKETDPAKLSSDMRVKAVWKPREQRQARMTDIVYFETIGGAR